MSMVKVSSVVNNGGEHSTYYGVSHNESMVVTMTAAW